MSKPRFFNRGRFDSPLEVLLLVSGRAGPIKVFGGLGPVLNVRVFRGERENVEDRRVEVSFGLSAATGIGLALSRRWRLELEVAYTYAVDDPVVEHELNATLGPAYVF